MGRPLVTKKGPWTPEEDLILVSHLQKYGDGKWKDVPVKTGLHRCSKSCRLRWSNYLRPGIKRGNFTPEEDDTIIRFQRFFPNRWATISKYLPQRTDNDIKNYWKTHLSKKLEKLEGQNDQNTSNGNQSVPRSTSTLKGKWEILLQTNVAEAKQALREAMSLGNDNSFYINQRFPNPQVIPSATYASSAENKARFLQNSWQNNSPLVTGLTASQVMSELSKNALSSNSPPFGGLNSSDGVDMSQITSPNGFDPLPSFNFVNSNGYSLDEVVNYQQQPQSGVFNDLFDCSMDIGSLFWGPNLSDGVDMSRITSPNGFHPLPSVKSINSDGYSLDEVVNYQQQPQTGVFSDLFDCSMDIRSPFWGPIPSDGVDMSRITSPYGFHPLSSVKSINSDGYSLDDEVNYQQQPQTRVFSDPFDYNMDLGSHFGGPSQSDGVDMSRITSPKVFDPLLGFKPINSDGYALDDVVNYQQQPQTRVFNDPFWGPSPSDGVDMSPITSSKGFDPLTSFKGYSLDDQQQPQTRVFSDYSMDLGYEMEKWLSDDAAADLI